MELQDYRQQIDQIDAQLTELFQQRMQVSSGIAEYKKAHNLPVYDPARERAKLKSVAASARPELQEATERLYSMLFELSRGYQRSLNAAQTPLMGKVRHTLENTPLSFPGTRHSGLPGRGGRVFPERLPAAVPHAGHSVFCRL